MDDNHKVSDGWKKPADWITLATPEILACYRKWIREGLISVASTDLAFTSSTVLLTDPFAILDVVQSLGSGNYRGITPAQSTYGREPFWDNTVSNAGASLYWTAEMVTNDGDVNIGKTILTLHPPTAGNFIIRYIQQPLIADGATIYLPSGLDDYVALRIARKALASEGASSQAIGQLITVAEQEMKMDLFGKSSGDGPKVRINRSNSCGRFTRDAFTWNVNPYNWYYL